MFLKVFVCYYTLKVNNSKVPVINTHIVSVTKSLNMNVRNVNRLDVFIYDLWSMKNLLNYYELFELLWSYWSYWNMMTLLKLLNYDEVIEVSELWIYWSYWTMMNLLNFVNYELHELWTMNCYELNCKLWYGELLRGIQSVVFVFMCAWHERVTTIKSYKRLHSFV